MKPRLASAIAGLLLVTMPVFAHRLDEYLQATQLTIEKDSVGVDIRLTPGVQVFPIVFTAIDTNADGEITEAEQQAYARKVLRDLALSVDGTQTALRLRSVKFPSTAEMREGLGEIELKFSTNVQCCPSKRRLRFENHHQRPIAAYLVNCLMPRDPDIQVTAQHRDYEQSSFQMDYEQAAETSRSTIFVRWFRDGGWLSMAAILLFGRVLWLWRGGNSKRPFPGMAG